jgi:predicted amidohydrolase YtcJ
MKIPYLLYNARFHDFERPRRSINAIYINNGIIERIYKKKPRSNSSVREYDLKHHHVIPGFIDSHTHLISRGIELQRVDLSKCRSLSECYEKINAGLKTKEKVVFASSWDENHWPSFKQQDLDRRVLDKLSSKKPIIMRRICGHFAVVNTRALQCIPHTWRIVDKKRGFLYEDAALYLSDVFKPDQAMLKKAVRLGMAEALSKGITSVHEITNPRRFRLLQSMKKNKELRLRFSAYLLLDSFPQIFDAGFASCLGDDYLRFSGVKIFLDGSLGAKTAALTRPYIGSNNQGKVLITYQKLDQIVNSAEKNRIQLMIHSIGDRATRKALKVFDRRLISGSGVKTYNPLRHRLEHVELLDPAMIRKIARLGLICSMQPNFARIWQVPGALYEHYLGARYRRMNCYHTISKAGIKIVFGSDCMPMDPLYGLGGAIDHPFACGRLRPNPAYKYYTAAGAYPTFDEKRKGKIAPGFFADLAVLDRDPSILKNTAQIKVLMTMVNGNIVYGKKRL